MDNENINLVYLWNLVRRGWKKILVLAVIGGVVGYGIARLAIPAKYSSSVSLLVNQRQDQSVQGQNFNDQQADVMMINTYKDIITRPVILNQVAKDLTTNEKVKVKDAVPAKYSYHYAKYPNANFNVGNLASSISVSNQANSQVFTVTVNNEDPVVARDIANEVANVFESEVPKIMNIKNVSIVSHASVNRTPISLSAKIIALAGILAGVALGVAWELLHTVTDRTVKSLDFLTDDLGLTNLGIVNFINSGVAARDLAKQKKEQSENINEIPISRLGRRV